MSSYCLRRNNHCYDLANHFERMYKEESMVDVTLSCGDGYIKAHKMVLSACSSYFKSIFSKFTNPYQYPVVIIKDMPFSDLRSIIEFIYRGEITVSQSRLASVLLSAEALKVKGLSDARRQMDSDGTNLTRKKRKRRRKNKSNQENISEASNGNNEKDHAGDENIDSNLDKTKESDQETSEYTTDDETEKEDGESSIIMVTTHDDSGRVGETNSTTTNNDNDFEPARLLEQSMITDEDRASSSRNRGFHDDINISDTNIQANLNQDINHKSIIFGQDNSGMNALLNHTPMPPSHPIAATTPHNHVSNISGLNTFDAHSILLPGPSNVTSVNRSRHHHHHHNHHHHSQEDKSGDEMFITSQELHIHGNNSGNRVNQARRSTRSEAGVRQRFQCHVCFQLFTEKRNLQRHMQIHSHSRNKFDCELCGKTFSWKHTFNSHKEKIHGIVDF